MFDPPIRFLPDLSENPPGKFGGEEFTTVKCNNRKEVEAAGSFYASVFWHLFTMVKKQNLMKRSLKSNL